MKLFVSSENDLSMTRKNLWFITIVTTVYLSIELAFQARLLDVAGTMVSIEEVEGLEKFGRLISGTALYLLVLGVVLLPLCKKLTWLKDIPARMAVFIILAVLIIGSVFYGERMLVDHIVDSSSGEDRSVAAKAMIVQNSLLKGTISIDGMELSSDELNSPEGKSFAAVLPFLGSTILKGKLKKTTIRKIIENEVRAEIGDGNKFLKTNVHSELKDLDKAYYEQYAPATEKYRSADAKNIAKAKEKQAWAKYLNKLADQKIALENIPKDKWPEVREQVRASGLMVPNSWKPSDKKGFLRALGTKYYTDSKPGLRVEVEKRFDEYQAGLKAKRLTIGNIKERYWPRVIKEVRKKGLNPPDNWNPNDKIGFYAFMKVAYNKEVTRKFKKESEGHWQAYKKKVTDYRIDLNLSAIPKDRWPQIRGEVRKSGIAVPKGWRPFDRDIFENSFKKSYHAGVLKKFKQEAKKIFGFYPKYLVPGLSYEEFLANKDVKRYLGNKGKYIGKSNKHILQDIIKTKTNEQLRKFTAKPKDYENGGKYEEFGKRAMRGVVVPPFALFFSLLGGFIHIFKVFNFSLSFKIKPLLRLPLMVAGAAVIIFCISNIDLSNSITKSQLYGSLEASVSEVYHPVVATAVKVLIETAPVSYPINNGLREKFLMGYEFTPGHDSAPFDLEGNVLETLIGNNTAPIGQNK